MAKVTIPYGYNNSLSFNVPDKNLTEVLSPNKVDIPPNPQELIEQALENPVESGKIEEIVKRKKSSGKIKVCIICDDLTRSTPGYMIIPPILKRLNQAGIPDKDIFIIMALGTHRPMSEAEIIEKLGKEIYSRIKVYNSEFKDKSYKLVNIGTSPDGVPVWLDRRVSEADIKIGVGTIIPHPAAGCSGGAKIILPGVTGEDTVASFHLQYAATPENLFGQPTTPARQIMERLVEVVGLDFIINIVSTPDNEIYKVIAGHFIHAHRKGIKYMRDVYGIKVSSQQDIVVCSSHPSNLDFWQATKAVFAPDVWARPGGSIIIAASCPEGLGPHKEYADYIGNDNPQQLLDDAYAGKTAEPIAVSGGVTLSRMRKIKTFSLVSDGVDRKYADIMKWHYYAGLQEAVDSELKHYGRDAKVGVITHGGSSYLYFDD